MTRPIRIGIIGAGGNTRARHIPGFQALLGVEVAVVCNRTRESGGKVAREFGIGRVAAEWREVVNAPDVDAVCIGTWPYLHAELSIAALRAGKHVLTEARMARNLGEAEAMLAEARRHPRLVAQIVPAPMSLPFDATVAELLAAGTLGEVREVHAVCTHGGLAEAQAPFSWRQDIELSGKNTLFLGIYYEMVLRWLQREPESIVADAAIFTPRRRDETGQSRMVAIPESVTVLGRYAAPTGSGLAEGARLVLHCSGVETSAPRNELRINGAKAGLRLDLDRGELWLQQGGVERPVEIALARRGDWRVEADFIASIREGRPVRLTDFATGVKYMRFTDAVWESWSHGGRRVTL
jgi:predicted dehydrogenase